MNHKTNLGIRAVLHTVRKWKKTLLLFCLLLFITTLVLSGLAIADAQEEQSEELRGVTGASFTVNANNGYTLQPVTDEMIEELEGRSNHVFSLKAGTLYPLLHSLEEKNYLFSYEDEVNGKVRKYYSITDDGKKYLKSRKDEWQEYASAVANVLNAC